MQKQMQGHKLPKEARDKAFRGGSRKTQEFWSRWGKVVKSCMTMGIVGFAASILLSNSTSALMMLGVDRIFSSSSIAILPPVKQKIKKGATLGATIFLK